MKKVYKSKQSETAIMELYDKQINALNLDYEDLYVDTRFGKAHVVKYGNPNEEPLLLFHGGNNTTPYSLRYFPSLHKHLCLYAVDTVGHPGKSSQTVVSHKSMEYGEWASDVIASLGFHKINCLGGSFGGGILTKLMCVSPEKVEKAVLVVPAGIANVSTLNLIVSMGIPMMLYIVTKKDTWLKKAVLPMAVDEKNIDEATHEMVKNSFEHVAVKAGMPSNARADDLQCFTAPTLLIVAENDCMFPSKRVIAQAKKMISNLRVHTLKDQGHMFVLSDEDIDMIVQFIKEAPVYLLSDRL